jgi:hypothetical protein
MKPQKIHFRRYAPEFERAKFGLSTGPGDLHLSTFLTQMAMGYQPQGIIADSLFPVVRVVRQTDTYAVFSRQEMLTIESTTRGPGTEARKITRSVSSATYRAKNYALKTELTLEDGINADPILMMQLAGGRSAYLLNKLMLDWDVRVSNLVNSTSNVGSSAAPSSSWSLAGNPLGNMWTAIDNVRYSTGYRPNVGAFGPRAWDSFSRDSSVRNIIFGTNNGGGYPSIEQVKNLFQLDKVLLSGAFQSTANEAQAEAIATVWADNVLVAYLPPAPTVEDPSFAYSFRWSAAGLPELNVEVHPYDDKIKSQEFEVGFYQDEKITGSSYGFLINNVNSSH